MFDFEKYRRVNGTIKLTDAFKEFYPFLSLEDFQKAVLYFQEIESLREINSKQLAAICLVNAKLLIDKDKNV